MDVNRFLTLFRHILASAPGVWQISCFPGALWYNGVLGGAGDGVSVCGFAFGRAADALVVRGFFSCRTMGIPTVTTPLKGTGSQ